MRAWNSFQTQVRSAFIYQEHPSASSWLFEHLTCSAVHSFMPRLLQFIPSLSQPGHTFWLCGMGRSSCTGAGMHRNYEPSNLEECANAVQRESGDAPPHRSLCRARGVREKTVRSRPGVEWEEVWSARLCALAREEKQTGMHLRSEVATTLNLHTGWLPTGSTSEDLCDCFGVFFLFSDLWLT